MPHSVPASSVQNRRKSSRFGRDTPGAVPGTAWTYVKRQAVWVVVGLIVMVAVMAIDYRKSLLAAYRDPARPPWSVGHHFADWQGGAYYQANVLPLVPAQGPSGHDFVERHALALELALDVLEVGAARIGSFAEEKYSAVRVGQKGGYAVQPGVRIHGGGIESPYVK